MKELHTSFGEAGHESLTEAFEDAAPLEGGLTNDVRRTEYDTVIKEFAEDPPLAHVLHAYTIGQGLAADAAELRIDEAVETLDEPDAGTAQAIYKRATEHHEPVTQESRMDAELDAEAVLDELDIRTPAITAQDGELMEYEHIEGTPLPEYLQEADTDAAYEAAQQFGEDLAAMHDAGLARRDNRPENTLVEDGGTLAYIDHEYATTEASEADQTADLITFVSGARQLEPELYEIVREGFEDGYGAEAGTLVDLASPGSSIGHAVIEEGKDLQDTYREAREDGSMTDAMRETVDAAASHDYDRLRNAVKNGIGTLR